MIVLLFSEIHIRGAESYMKSPDWLVNKRATINPRNEKDNKCFQYAIAVALTYYYFQKIDIRRAESYIESSNWLKNKGTRINRKNEKI